MTERTDHEGARQRCRALVGKAFRSPGGVRGEYVGVLERPAGRPPVVVGKLPDGTALKYTPSKAESMLIEEGT